MKFEFELEQHEKTILWVVGGAAALIAAYWFLKSNGLWDQWFGSAPVPAPSPCPAPVQPAQAQPQSPNPYVQAMERLSALASAPQMTVDQWANLWQNGPAFAGAPMGFGVPESITPSVMGQLVAQSAGNPVSAQEFTQMIMQAQSSNLAGAYVN